MNTYISGSPREFYHRFVCIAPSSDHSLLSLNLPFKVILWRFEVVFWCLEWKCCTVQKIDENHSNPPIPWILYDGLFRHWLTLWRLHFKIVELWWPCCMMMFRWAIKQPGIQKFWHLCGHYQDIYDWILPLNKRSGLLPIILTQQYMGRNE